MCRVQLWLLSIFRFRALVLRLFVCVCVLFFLILCNMYSCTPQNSVAVRDISTKFYSNVYYVRYATSRTRNVVPSF